MTALESTVAGREAEQPQLPCVFVVGCPRSGTTLLQRILDHHPLLAVGYDTHFIPHAVRRVPVGVDPPLTAEMIQKVRGHRRFPRLGLSERAIDRAEHGARTYGEFVSGLYFEFARLQGKPLAGEKSPGYCRHLPRLHGLFPQARSIHLIRDGRDVALSILDWGKGQPGRLELWQKEPVGTCALWWNWKVERGIRDGAALGPTSYLEVSYEELAAHPETTVRTVTQFLDLPYSPELLLYHEGKTRDRPGISAKAAWLPPTAGLRDWRLQMKEADVELFEALSGDLLSKLGYERFHQRISPPVSQRAARCRDWWEREFSGSQ